MQLTKKQTETLNNILNGRIQGFSTVYSIDEDNQNLILEKENKVLIVKFKVGHITFDTKELKYTTQVKFVIKENGETTYKLNGLNKA